MKKTLITIFSISITAGTVYYGYSKFKEFTIRKLVATWTKQLLDTNPLSEEQQKKLQLELDKLFVWDLQLLVKLTSKIVEKVPESDKAVIGKKLVAKKIFDKADLKAVSEFLEYKKYS
ncbi:MAG TPA: hypothetical protein VLB84_02705 [Bacteroidia bacterium]|nr:hypothetical protein [Bacteroidia bacterium]